MSDFTKLHRLERVANLNGASTKARAVWSLCHHALDRRGQMKLGGAEWKSVMVRRLGVDTSERQWFYAGLRELEIRGLISVAYGVFSLLGHAGSDPDLLPTFPGPVADLHPTSSGPTTDLLPTSARPLPDLLPTCSGPSPDLLSGSLGNHSVHAPRARVQNREEENRIEKSRGDFSDSATPRLDRGPPKVRAPRDVDPSDAAIAATIRAEIPAMASLDPKTAGVRKPLGTLRAWAKRRGGDPLESIRLVARGACGDDWLAERGYPLAALAKHPDKYATRATAPRASPLLRGMAPAASHEEHAEIVRRLGNGGPSVREFF